MMGFATYILSYGLVRGRNRDFSPELLVETFSSSMTLVALQFLLIVGGNFALGEHAFKYNYLDLVGLLSYKFAGITTVIILGSVFEDSSLFGKVWFSRIYYGIVLYTAICSSYFLSKNIHVLMEARASEMTNEAVSGDQRSYGYGHGYNTPDHSDRNGPSLSKRQRILLLVLAVSEVLAILFLGYVVELTEASGWETTNKAEATGAFRQADVVEEDGASFS